MYEKVKQARKVIDIFMYSYIVLNVLLVLVFFVKYGIEAGISKMISLGVSTVLTVALLFAIKDGNMAARIVTGILLFISAVLGFDSVLEFEFNVYDISLLIISVLFFAMAAFVLFSPQVNSISKYNKIHKNVLWLWNWEGICIGYSDKGYLWDEEGKLIGKFVSNEIYSCDGKYMGEIYDGNKRLSICKYKLDKRIDKFDDPGMNYRLEKMDNTSTMPIYSQFEDFKYQG
jgi:hypothetical protein